jgi:gas vesicle protein
VTDNSQVVAATVAGAIIGGVAGYLFFTDPGRSLRRRLEPVLDEFASELSSFRLTVQKAAGVANEGWRLLNEASGDGDRQSSQYGSSQRTSPF